MECLQLLVMGGTARSGEMQPGHIWRRELLGFTGGLFLLWRGCIASRFVCGSCDGWFGFCWGRFGEGLFVGLFDDWHSSLLTGKKKKLNKRVSFVNCDD